MAKLDTIGRTKMLVYGGLDIKKISTGRLLNIYRQYRDDYFNRSPEDGEYEDYRVQRLIEQGYTEEEAEEIVSDDGYDLLLALKAELATRGPIKSTKNKRHRGKRHGRRDKR